MGVCRTEPQKMLKLLLTCDRILTKEINTDDIVKVIADNKLSHIEQFNFIKRSKEEEPKLEEILHI